MTKYYFSLNFKILCFVLVATSLNVTYSQEKKNVSIGLLGDKLSSVYDESIIKLKDEIRAVVGEDATISFKDILLNDFDQNKARENYLQLVQDDTDLILSLGLMNNIMLYYETTFPKPTLALGAISSDLIKLPENQNTTNRFNFNYIIASISYDKDLLAFSNIYDYSSIGIIVDEMILDTLPLEQYFNDYFAKSSIDYRFLLIDDNNQLNGSFENLDAVYFAGGYYLNDDDFSAIVDQINKKKLPSFSAFGLRDLDRGVLATNQPDSYIDNYIRRISLNIEAIVNGINPSELPIIIDYKEQLTLNFKTADEIGFPLRFSSLNNVNFMGSTETKVSGEVYSLSDIMRKVVGSNLSLTAEKKEVDLNEQDVKISKSNFLPNLNVGVGGLYIDPKIAEISNGNNPEFSTSGNIQLSQTIYSEEAAANVTISEKQLQAKQENYNMAELDAALNGAIAYFNALIYKSNLRIQNENLKTTRQNLRIAELNFEVGESSKYDELRFKSELAANTQNFLNAINDFTQSLYDLNQLMNNPIDLDIDLQDIDLDEGAFKDHSYNRLKELFDNPSIRPSVISFLVEEALKNSPELKEIGFTKEANERYYRLNNSGRFIPTVNLVGQYNHELSRSGKGSTYPRILATPPDGSYNVALNLSLPLFDQNRRNINKQSAIIQRDQFDLYQMDLEQQIEKRINDIISDLMNRIANIEISKMAEDAAREALDLTQSSYAEGESLLIELVDAQNTYLQAKLSSANAVYNYLLAGVNLERAIGHFFLLKTEEENLDLINRANQFILERN